MKAYDIEKHHIMSLKNLTSSLSLSPIDFVILMIDYVSQSSKIAKEEIFGPVITLQRFSSEAEAIKLANDSDYGLAATIWTQDTAKAHRVATQVESGIAWINCWLVRDLRTPFGGVKSSGLGREGGFEALRFFTEPQSVCIPTR